MFRSYGTIQDAIDAANPGDTIFVPTGIFHENVVINKAVTLIGENKEDTILAGDSSGIGFRVTSNDVTIKKFTIRDFEHGIYINGRQNVSIEDMNIIGNIYGVRALYANQIEIRNCFLINRYGVVLDHSNQSIIANNFFNGYGAVTWGGDGVFLDSSIHNTIDTNVMTFARISLYIVDSDWNLFKGNMINGSAYGIQIRKSTNNTFYHNNIFDNKLYNIYTLLLSDKPNTWDNGYPSGGNYWSDYSGIDIKGGSNQNETESDGIGDAPYEIDVDNRDRYPVMGPFNMFDAGTWSGVSYNVDVVSNSTSNHTLQKKIFYTVKENLFLALTEFCT